MGWFSNPEKATAVVEGDAVLRLRRPASSDVRVDLARSPWLVFAQVGDDSAPVFEGWWLIGTPDGAVAIKDDCPMADGLLRDGELAGAADRVPDKFVLFLMSRPWAFRNRDARDGVVLLDAEQASALRSKGTSEPAQRVADLPIVA